MHKYQSLTNFMVSRDTSFWEMGGRGVVAAGGEGTFVAGNPTISVLSPPLQKCPGPHLMLYSSLTTLS